MTRLEILRILKSKANKKNRDGMARYGINVKNAYGVSVSFLRMLAEKTGKDHKLADSLWKTGVHEARILAGIIAEPVKFSSAQMDGWTGDFDSWGLCDTVCNNVFRKTPFAYDKIPKYIKSRKEFVKRAGFVLIAVLAVHDKNAPDRVFEGFLKQIKEHSTDERNFVKKAVNWALRHIGKRNIKLNKKAVKCAEDILKEESKSAKWIAKDAIRELTDPGIMRRIRKKG